jgi:hypothetical protein
MEAVRLGVLSKEVRLLGGTKLRVLLLWPSPNSLATTQGYLSVGRHTSAHLILFILSYLDLIWEVVSLGYTEEEDSLATGP